jgi:hypothetical protein
VSPVWSEERLEYEDGLIKIKKDGLYNFLSDGKYISDTWFNWTGVFHDGHCIVKIKTKYNVITLEREDYNSPEMKEILEQPYIEEVSIEKIKVKTLIKSKPKENE